MITEQIYERYLGALIGGQRFVCHGIVQDLIQRNISLDELYLDLFQKSMYQVGALWESNQLSVSTEHLATAITESLMTLAYPLLFAQERTGNSAIVACIAHEFHQLGAKMVADFMELAGWDSYFLGGNTPTGDILSLIAEKKPTVLVAQPCPGQQGGRFKGNPVRGPQKLQQPAHCDGRAGPVS